MQFMLSVYHFQDWFRIDEETGDVIVNSALSQEDAARLSLPIQATDVAADTPQTAIGNK